MAEIFNLHGDEWDRDEQRPGWINRRAWVGRRIGADLIGATLCEVEPGSRLWPYHTHHANEEWLIVVSGEPTLRTPDGETRLSPGDVVAFTRGPGGLHQVRNDSAERVRVLMLSTEIYPEVIEYADSGKVATVDAAGEDLLRIRPGAQLDYWDGED
ncbi:MAG TPA: cupin domain-containing protein [Solirubrobacteraceae bacterium]|nr:cupin domain-containing protein [Solirubrobacteraceae bacterium]